MTWMTLDAVAEGGVFTDGDWVESKDQDPTGEVRLTQLADVGVGEFRDRSNRRMRWDQFNRLDCTRLLPHDILVARMPEPIGRSCLMPENIGPAVTVVDVAVIRVARSDVTPRYAMWMINSPQFQSAVAGLQSGTTRKRISRKRLAGLSIPVPDLAEQRRVVDLLEDHLSRLDFGVALLNTARLRAEAMRSSLLWRLPRSHPVPLEQLAVSSSYGTSAKCVVDGPGAPVARIPNLRAGVIDMTDEKRIADATVDVSSLMLTDGDFVVVRTNGSRRLIGRSAVVQPGVRAAYASYLIRFRLDQSRVRPAWVHLVFESPQVRRQLESLAASSAGQFNLGLKKLGGISIPCPPLADQDAAIDHVGEIDETLDRLATSVSEARRRASALRGALLAAAFSGRL